MLDQFESTFTLVSKAPLLGRSGEELAPRLHSFPVGNYLVFQLPRRDGIMVVRVLSGYRNLAEFFR